nr:acyltransferase [Gabonia massiliensis]
MFTIGIFLLSLQPINTKLNLNIKIIDILGLLNWKYFIYFTFGILVKKHFTLFQQLIDHKTIYMVIMVALFVISYICLLRMSYSENIWDKRIDFMLRIIVAILAIIVTFAIFRHYQNLFSKQKKIGRILQFIGTHTLDIYLLHYILIPQNLIMIGRFFQTNVNPLIEFTITVILALLIIAACLTISTIIRTSPILSTLVFGIKPKSKN